MGDSNALFERNLGSLSEKEIEELTNIKVLVIGCGGSGYLVDMLTRLGIGHIGIVDGDTYEASNINRQMLCNQATIGREKVIVASKYMTSVNPDIIVEAYDAFLNQENSVQIISKYDYIFDCTDNMRDKRIIQNACNECNKPLIV